MFKRILLSMILMATICIGEEVADPGGYRGAQWGMSPEEVRAVFPDVKWKFPKAKHGFSYFNDKVMGIKASKYFYYEENKKLYKVEITPKPTTGSAVSTLGPVTDIDMYGRILFSVFQKLKQAMIKKYGEPSEDKCVNQTKYVDIEEAVVRGGAECYVLWLFESTRIRLQIKRQFSRTMGAGLWKALLIYESLKIQPPISPEAEEDI